jgi:hypothetical protein
LEQFFLAKSEKFNQGIRSMRAGVLPNHHKLSIKALGGTIMLKKLVWGCILCLISASTSLAQAAVVEFEGRYWITNLSAEAKVTEAGNGTDIDLKRDLGIADQNFLSGRFSVNIGPNHRLTLNYTPIRYSINSNIKRTVEFAGETYAINTRVLTSLDLQYLRIGWAYQFVNVEGGKFKFGTLVEVKGAQGDVSLAAPDLGIDNAWNFKAWLPTLGLAMDINPVPFINIFAEISGLPAGQYGTIWEGEAGIKFIPFKNFTVSGGYRIVEIDARNDPDYATVKLGGPFVGLSLRF